MKLTIITLIALAFALVGFVWSVIDAGTLGVVTNGLAGAVLIFLLTKRLGNAK